jgi:uncharacterized membrane protein
VYGVIEIELHAQTMIDYFETYAFLSKISPFIPTIAVSVINIIVPTVTEKMVNFEKWDYSNTVIQ